MTVEVDGQDQCAGLWTSFWNDSAKRERMGHFLIHTLGETVWFPGA